MTWLEVCVLLSAGLAGAGILVFAIYLAAERRPYRLGYLAAFIILVWLIVQDVIRGTENNIELAVALVAFLFAIAASVDFIRGELRADHEPPAERRR